MTISNRKMTTIGILAIVFDEFDYISKWIDNVRRFPESYDKILVIDGGSTDGTIDKLRERGISVIEHKFNHHFADQRNFGIEQIGTDWILELDADEKASSPLLGGLRQLVNDAEIARMECLGLPRLNFIDGSLVASPGTFGLDFQYRLHKKCCRWRGAVHEEITGYRTRKELLVQDGHFLIHDKSSDRYKKRNDYYSTIRP